MIPESRLIRSEIILRDLSLPADILIAKKSLIRWLALSFGLIMPNESRKLVLDVLDVLIQFHLSKQAPTTKDILAKMSESLGSGQNTKAVYYHLQRLQESGLITRRKGRYYFGEGEGQTLKEAFHEAYARKADKSFVNIDTVLEKLQNSY